MKTFFCLMTVLLISLNVFGQEATNADKSSDEIWKEANTSYVNANYGDAILKYETLLARGIDSWVLYYNLGNAYFKEGNIAKSILNYNRAERLAPANSDVAYNLAIANTYVKDKIDAMPVFFVKRWIQQARGALSSNAWAIMSLVFFALFLTALIFYLLMSKLSWRKMGFYGGILSLLLFIISLSFSWSEKKQIDNPTKAVIMESAVPVKSSPDNGSKDIFVLHAGTKVEVISELNGWREIMISDGNKGWIKGESIEMI